MVPFKTIPRIINGRGSPSDLKGKEVLAHLMLDIDSASDIDKYKFSINPKIYNHLLYKKLTEMLRPTGWRWKKASKKKKDKYDKLMDEYLPLLSQEVSMPAHEIRSSKYDIILRKMLDNDDFREEVVNKMLAYNDVQDTKKIDKYRKKYDIKIKQKTLF